MREAWERHFSNNNNNNNNNSRCAGDAESVRKLRLGCFRGYQRIRGVGAVSAAGPEWTCGYMLRGFVGAPFDFSFDFSLFASRAFADDDAQFLDQPSEHPP